MKTKTIKMNQKRNKIMLKINYSELMLIKETYKTRLLKIIEAYNKIIIDNNLSKDILNRMRFFHIKEDLEHLINEFNLVFEFNDFLEILESLEKNEKEYQIKTEYTESFRGEEEYFRDYYYIPLSLFNNIEEENYDFKNDLEGYLLGKYKEVEEKIEEERKKKEEMLKEKEKQAKEEKYKMYMKLKEEFKEEEN